MGKTSLVDDSVSNVGFYQDHNSPQLPADSFDIGGFVKIGGELGRGYDLTLYHPYSDEDITTEALLGTYMGKIFFRIYKFHPNYIKYGYDDDGEPTVIQARVAGTTYNAMALIKTIGNSLVSARWNLMIYNVKRETFFTITCKVCAKPVKQKLGCSECKQPFADICSAECFQKGGYDKSHAKRCASKN